MTEQFDEKFSAYVDGEERTNSELLNRLRTDDTLRARWSRYHLIRDVMTNHYRGNVSLDIAASISEKLASEPTILSPRRRSIVDVTRTLGRQAMGYALAATVAGVSVFTVQQYSISRQGGGEMVAIAKASPENLSNMTVAENSDVQNKLSAYLVTHNEYSTSSRMQGMMPYMRLVSQTSTQQSK